jgi:hypothetical protein
MFTTVSASPRGLRLVLFLSLSGVACSTGNGTGAPQVGITAERHAWFPITSGTTHDLESSTVEGPMACTSCHADSNDSFKQFQCTGCHEHAMELTDPLHKSVKDYRYTSEGCYACHGDGARGPFTHFRVTDGCAACHNVGTPFAALPIPDGRMHPDMHGADCGVCHLTTSWKGAGDAPVNAHDPSNDYSLDGYVPTWSGTTITSLTAKSQALQMKMNHASMQIPPAAMSACGNCHADADAGSYYPGTFHLSLNSMMLAPLGCSDCHANAAPEGFVGPPATAPVRSPPSPEMRHEAVAWVNGAPGTQALVPQDCGLCHLAPTNDIAADWSTNSLDGGQVARYHASLGPTKQPAGCLDCHANTRPTAPLTLGTGIQFDHQQGAALGECKQCHQGPAAVAALAWAGGAFHAAGAPLPTTCLPCHESERPTSTTTWTSATYSRSPFDYVTNSRGITHGSGQDCVVCHSRTQDWTGGSFPHGPSSIAATRCVSCHSSQRPDLLPGATAASMTTLLGFDHSINGTGDCFGCHQATVSGGRYIDLYRAGGAQTVSNLRGGDWDGGATYPGGSLTSSTDQSNTVTEYTLVRSGSGMVTGATAVPTIYYNGMLHTSSMVAPPNVPATLSPGSTGNPNYSACWHCHTNTNGTVTAYSNGVYHASLTGYRATPGSAVAPIAQPTKQCTDCHSTMLPAKLVQAGTTNLQPMDHGTQFTGTVNIGGAMVSRVSQLDCSTCHTNPGGAWNDGRFHSRIGSAVPTDCVSCHYLTMADATKADVTQAPAFKMSHRSAQVATQSCQTCHAGALARSATTPTSSSLWRDATGPATFHPHVTSQPSACIDCHTVSQPTGATVGTVLYAAANQYQWMNHASPQIAGKECAVCHAADATSSGSAWNRSAKFHGPVASATTCRECHGLTNGMGSTPGTNNNLPAGLTTTTTTITSASASTGVAGQHDQISHADVNTTNNDCKLCHTQQGQSTSAPVQGHEWAQATFHKNFNSATPLVINATTGRCSHCHMNVKPGTGYTAQDHSAFTATSAQDCSSCHAYPGSSAASPDWKGATGAHASTGSTASSALDCNTCHGLNGSSQTHLAVAASSHYGGITNGNTCTSCHVDFTAFSGPVTYLKYAHTNGSANSGGCRVCHVFTNQLYTTMTTTPGLSHPNGGNRNQFSQTFNVTGSVNGRSFTSPHTDSRMVRCEACHQYSTTTASTNIWTFGHRPYNPGVSNSTSSGGCNQCH